jgi:hypothetical protein
VLCPDGPCLVAGGPTRLRRLFGRGFVVLTATPSGKSDLAATLAAAGCPIEAYALDEIDVDGAVSAALGPAAAAAALLVRPDGHLAAVLHGAGRPADDLAAALRRARAT